MISSFGNRLSKEPIKYDKPVKLTVQFVGEEDTTHFTYDEVLSLDEKGIMYVHSVIRHQIFAINFNNAKWWTVEDEEMEEK